MSSTSHKNIRVMLVDDHQLVLDSTRALLVREGDMEIVATAMDGLEAIRLADATVPDVIVMDVFMPELDGIRAAGIICARNPVVEIILLSVHMSSTLLQQARKHGAAAYVSKQRAQRDLIPAIREASARATQTHRKLDSP